MFREVLFLSEQDVEDCRRNSTTKFACRFVGFLVSGSSADGLVVYGWPGFPFFGRLRMAENPTPFCCRGGGDAPLCIRMAVREPSSGLVRVGVPPVSLRELIGTAASTFVVVSWRSSLLSRRFRSRWRLHSNSTSTKWSMSLSYRLYSLHRCMAILGPRRPLLFPTHFEIPGRGRRAAQRRV